MGMTWIGLELRYDGCKARINLWAANSGIGDNAKTVKTPGQVILSKQFHTAYIWERKSMFHILPIAEKARYGCACTAATKIIISPSDLLDSLSALRSFACT
jgi:hypothetical protein